MTATTTTEIAPKKRVSLYSLSAAFDALEALLDELPAGATDEDHAVIDAWLAELDGALEEKLTGVVAWAREQEALAAAAKVEADRLRTIATRRVNRVAKLKASVRDILEKQGTKRIDTRLGPVRIVANGGALPVALAENLDVEALPDDCKRTKTEPVIDALRKRLVAGEQIPGASLGVRGSRIELG